MGTYTICCRFLSFDGPIYGTEVILSPSGLLQIQRQLSCRTVSEEPWRPIRTGAVIRRNGCSDTSHDGKAHGYQPLSMIRPGSPSTRRRRGVRPDAPFATVVTYLRVSTSEQALSGLGIDAQRATVADYAERKGLTILGEYCDEGISAKSLKGRPAALA